jgi:membrane-anchored glycerophosphoryl diester phosphodiesterase (GDPDase)
MADTDHFSERLREPLNETTRKVRRNLLASALLGIVITRVGLVPEKFSAFGVEFTSANQQALITLLIAVVLYFSVSFLVYVYSELTAWQIVFTSKELEALKEASKSEASLRRVSRGHISFIDTSTEAEDVKFREHVRFLYQRSRPTFYLRLSVELVIPIVFALYSCYTLATFEVSQDKGPASKVETPANKALNKDAPPKGGAPVS